jgi:hypothetical protein
MIGFISTLVTHIHSLIHIYYSAIADLHDLQFTVAHALGLSISTSRLLATDLNTETSASNHYESSCYLAFSHSVLLCPNLYSINLHNSLRTRSILVLLLSTAEPSLTLFPDGFVSLTRGFSAMTYYKRLSLSPINLRHAPHKKHLLL